MTENFSNSAETFRVVDLFAGTGAIGLGLNMGDQRFKTVLANDINELACQTTALNHPEAQVVCAPVSALNTKTFDALIGSKSIDVVIGGPPCQGFSSLRPSRGKAIEDPRNSLYQEFQRIVGLLQPKVILLENVVGLVNAAKGSLLKDLIQGFEELNYSCDWRIFNSAQFGVPQKRERFFLLGVRRDVLGTRVLMLPTPTHRFSGRTIGLKDKSRLVISDSKDLPPALTAWEAISDLPSIGSGESSNEYATDPANSFQALMRANSEALRLHVAANHNSKMLSVIRAAGQSKSALPEGMVSSGYSSCYSKISPDEPAPTVTVKFTSPASSKCIHPWDLRSITPREAARFQSFPDAFEFAGSKTEIAAQIGNAVPPLLGRAFAPIIADYILGGQ